MRISPSLASADLLHMAEEIEFADRYFNEIHLDIEDGVVVSGITFGTKMCRRICEYSHSSVKSIHLEVLNPMDYLIEIQSCQPTIVFIQLSHLKHPDRVVNAFKKAGLRVGISLNAVDRTSEHLAELLNLTDYFLIATAFPEDPKQKYQKVMEEFALQLAENHERKIWIDGGATAEIIHRLSHSPIAAVVAGRAVFEDKDQAVRQFCLE